MEWLSLELKLISCRDLKAFNFFQKLSVYTVVSIFNDELKKNEQQDQCLQRQKTPVDREGGSHPEWNHGMLFDLKPISLPENGDHLFLRFELRCEGVIFGNRTIGEVCVPFKDLIDEFNGTVRFVSYQVRNSDGKANGVLNFSYKVNGKSKKNDRIDSPKLDKPLEAHFSPKKFRDPPLEVHVQSSETCFYPSLDDIRSPSPRTGVPSPEFYYPVKACYTMTPPPLPPQLPALAVGHGVYYHQYPLPLAQTPGPYWYTSEATAYGCGLHG